MRKLDPRIVLIRVGNGGISLATATECVKQEAYVFVTELL